MYVSNVIDVANGVAFIAPWCLRVDSQEKVDRVKMNGRFVNTRGVKL